MICLDGVVGGKGEENPGPCAVMYLANSDGGCNSWSHGVVHVSFWYVMEASPLVFRIQVSVKGTAIEYTETRRIVGSSGTPEGGEAHGHPRR